MRALVISGGGSKGAFAGGVAQYLIEEQKREYDIFVGTSTGSLLIPQLALGGLDRLHKAYTKSTQADIFSVNPFVVRKKHDREYVTINYLTTLMQFIRRRRTFGESKSLRKTIKEYFTEADYLEIIRLKKELVVSVSNLSRSRVEYKSIHDFTYEEFVDWIWISANYIPFMSLVEKDGFEYGDGGLGAIVPIREAIRRGATEVDVVILESEQMNRNRILGKNPFSLMLNLFGFLVDQIKSHDISEGILSAKHNNVALHLYYTPTQLTENSLVFNSETMKQWWIQGYEYAKQKQETHSSPILKKVD